MRKISTMMGYQTSRYSKTLAGMMTVGITVLMITVHNLYRVASENGRIPRELTQGKDSWAQGHVAMHGNLQLMDTSEERDLILDDDDISDEDAEEDDNGDGQEIPPQANAVPNQSTTGMLLGPDTKDIQWLTNPRYQSRNVSQVYMYTSSDVSDVVAKSQRKRFPDCLIIGSRKSGTGALLNFLNMHPRIVSTKHEPAFFSNETNYARGLQWYLDKLPVVRGDQILIEKSAEYFHTFSVAKRVHAFNPNMKLLLIVRDPYTRMLSDYLFLNRFGERFNAPEGKASIKDLLVNSTTGRINVDWGCLKRSVYYMFFEEWLKYFPRRQIHVVHGDSFADSNPGIELRKVEAFFGIPSMLGDSKFYFSKTKGFYCMKGFGCMGKEKGHPQPVLPEGHETGVRNFFKPYNERFYKLVGQNFTWQT